MSTDTSTAPEPRPQQGTRAELEATQRWWLRRVYVPAMTAIGLGALVTGVVGTGDRSLSLALCVVVAASLVGAGARFRAQQRTTGGLALDERDEQATMRTMGYAYCFAFFGGLAWSVVWAATHDGGVPVPILALCGLVVALVLGRLCTRREGF